MASNERNTPDQPVQDIGEADFAKALQELAKGERTATALEKSLSTMEAKIEALLQQAEKEQSEAKSGSDAASTANNGAPDSEKA